MTPAGFFWIPYIVGMATIGYWLAHVYGVFE